ncbi:MAG: hypothetical protein AAF483_02250 [Planctomycetota bacterium]
MAMETSNPKEPLSSFDDFEEDFAFWPLNLILVILGASIIGVAFVYLDAHDARLHYNPWAYVVATPIVLLLMSVVLRTLVSRVVEKSMQMAFLLSVLVHLFMLVGAMNVVIFSRLWPDMLDKLAKQRHELKRESLQAPQYQRVTSTSQDGARPDYLTHLPTQHEATEVELTEKLAVNLAESAVNNLVSPIPEVQRNANPHLIEQNRASPALPTNNDQAAELSRSDLQSERQIESQVEYQMPQIQDSPELSASEANANRSRQSPASSSAMLDAPRNSASAARAADMQRNERRESSAERSQSASRMSKAQRNSQPTFRPSRIATPDAASPESTIEKIAANPATQPARNSSNRVSQQAAVMSASQLPEFTTAPSLTTPSMERQQARQVPQATTGQYSSAFERNTAGGRAGPAAPSSMPVQGVDAVAGEQVAAPQLRASQLTTSRSGTAGRAASSNATVGMPQAPTWDGSPSLAGGTQGVSPSQLANAATDGDAAGSDVAGLTGSGRTMQRSRSGLTGIVGQMTNPSAPSVSPNQGDSNSGSNSGQLQSNVLANSGGGRRSRSDGSATGMVGNSLGSPSTPSKIGESTGQMVRNERANTTGQSNSPNNGEASSPFQKSDSRRGGGPPTKGSVAVPDASSMAEKSGGNQQGETMKIAGNRDARRRSSSASNLLAINAPTGTGGIARNSSSGGELLPQRNEMAREIRMSDLETQRFARRNIGGPLAAGRISIPKPAFQQRIERLRDKAASEETAAAPQTELAIERGLEFLAKYQRDDGSWRLQDFDTQVLMTSDTAATGLALLAFQGAGYTHKDFKYAEVCKKAVKFLAENQSENGDLYIPQNPASDQNAWLYSHGIAAIAMCEAYGMTQDPDLKEPAQLALDFIATSQDKRRGGWRYSPGRGSDTSVSGWFMMALMSGKLAGLQIDESVLIRLRGFLDLSQDVNGKPHLYRYNPYAADNAAQGHGLKPTSVMTSVGLLMRLYTGWQRDEEAMKLGAEHLLENLPEGGTPEASKRDTYYWYYATQVMFHMGGETWETWDDELYPMLVANQVTSGRYEGSWNPVTPTPDLWARYGGRLYVTTMNLLSLEVTYRHLPLYDATGFEDQ